MPLAKAIGEVRASIATGAEQQRMLDFAIHTRIEHEFAASAQHLSLQHWDDGDEEAGGDVIFPGGYDQILPQVAAGLDIRLSHVVTRVNYGAETCTVTTNHGVFTAAQVLVTLPIGVLKAGSVEFVPALPDHKQQAVSRLGSGLLDKLYLKFEAPFWPATHVINRDDAKPTRWPEFLNVHALIGQPILLGFNAASYARVMQAKSDAEVVADALAALREVFGNAIAEPKGFLRTRWAADPYALGSYSYLAVGSSLRDRLALAAPIGQRLYFAGEATHREHAATVHGALLSGRAAARAMGEA